MVIVSTRPCPTVRSSKAGWPLLYESSAATPAGGASSSHVAEHGKQHPRAPTPPSRGTARGSDVGNRAGRGTRCRRTAASDAAACPAKRLRLGVVERVDRRGVAAQENRHAVPIGRVIGQSSATRRVQGRRVEQAYCGIVGQRPSGQFLQIADVALETGQTFLAAPCRRQGFSQVTANQLWADEGAATNMRQAGFTSTVK